MRLTLTILLGLLLGASTPANDYALTAKVLSAETNSNTSVRPVMNMSTGVITGSSLATTSYDREEIQVGNTVYNTSLLSRGGINGGVGDTFPARLGKKRKLSVIYLFGKDKHGKDKEVCLEIIGERSAQ